MFPSYRIIKDILTIIPALALFLLISVNPLAQSTKLPAPATHVSDFAGVLDAQTKSRLDTVLQKLKEKSQIELYVTTVDTTGEQQISTFSQQLARDWNIAVKNSNSKSLLLVVSVSSKTSFTQFSRAAQLAVPEGLIGEMSYRMQGLLSDGRFGEAIDSAVHVFVNAVAEKLALNVAELESSTVAVSSPEVTAEVINASTSQKTRPRTVTEAPKAEPEPTPPGETPKPTETPVAEPASSESPKSEPVLNELPKPTVTPTETAKESPKTEPPTTGSRKASATTRITPVRKKTPAEIAEEDADESEAVELVLTRPLDRREEYLKDFLDKHPKSKSRGRAIELLISTHAGLGDQKLKDGDIAGGVQQLLSVIDEADVKITDELFNGVIAQIPTNLYVRGERDAAFKAAQSIETKFGSDPKRLVAVGRFYMGIERASEAVRIADTAVRLAPDLAEAHRLLAMGHHISLRLDDAIAEYKKALELDPNSKTSRASLADLYRASGKSEEALTLYNEQLLWDPKDRAARSGKVLALLELRRSDEANSALEATLADEPRHLALLAGAAYWFAAHDNNDKAYELARKAVDIEPRYTWGQIALARSLVLKRPLEAERAIRTARKFGKFPTLTYELANVLASMGFYQEAADVLRESFTIKDDKIETLLAGYIPASESGFLELLAPERRAGFYQSTAADTAANAKTMKALLVFTAAITPAEGEKINEAAAVAAAKEFASGNDSMRAFRNVYAASRLLRNGIGTDTVLELIAEATKASEDALKVPALTMAVQADEFRDLRGPAIAVGNVPDVADAPREVLTNILKGRLEDLQGWALFHQEKYTDALAHLQKAAEILPAETPAWRTAVWHVGVALEQSGQKEQALDAYIKSYRGGPPESVRRAEIERLYRSIKGSLDGLEDRLLGIGDVSGIQTASNTAPASTPTETPKSETAPAPAPSPESSAPPPANPEVSDDALKNAASRLRANIKITGRIVDATHVGLADVVVVLISPSGAVIAATTNNEGIYSFKIAPSQKTYRVIPSKDGYTFTPIDRALAGLIDDQRDINFVGSKP